MLIKKYLFFVGYMLAFIASPLSNVKAAQHPNHHPNHHVDPSHHPDPHHHVDPSHHADPSHHPDPSHGGGPRMLHHDPHPPLHPDIPHDLSASVIGKERLSELSSFLMSETAGSADGSPRNNLVDRALSTASFEGIDLEVGRADAGAPTELAPGPNPTNGGSIITQCTKRVLKFTLATFFTGAIAYGGAEVAETVRNHILPGAEAALIHPHEGPLGGHNEVHPFIEEVRVGDHLPIACEELYPLLFLEHTGKFDLIEPSRRESISWIYEDWIKPEHDAKFWKSISREVLSLPGTPSLPEFSSLLLNADLMNSVMHISNHDVWLWKDVTHKEKAIKFLKDRYKEYNGDMGKMYQLISKPIYQPHQGVGPIPFSRDMAANLLRDLFVEKLFENPKE